MSEKDKAKADMKTNWKNPKWIIRYGANGKIGVRNIDYDPTKCEVCGKRHWVFQKKCRI